MGYINPILGYAGRTLVGFILALFFGAVGVVVARMALVLFGLTSWESWFFSFMAGASVGAGIGSLVAWLWLRNTGRAFLAILFVMAILAGAIGGWGGYSIGEGIQVECCGRRDVGAQELTVLGATIGANLTALCVAILGHIIPQARRSGHNRGSYSGPTRSWGH